MKMPALLAKISCGRSTCLPKNPPPSPAQSYRDQAASSDTCHALVTIFVSGHLALSFINFGPNPRRSCVEKNIIRLMCLHQQLSKYFTSYPNIYPQIMRAIVLRVYPNVMVFSITTLRHHSNDMCVYLWISRKYW